MTIEQQVCSLELAKRLKELGVHSDALWAWIDIDKPYLVYRPSTGDSVGISAFTVAELGEMLRCHFDTFFGGRLWYVTMPISGREFTAETEADARAKMLIHLIEQGVIDPKNV